MLHQNINLKTNKSIGSSTLNKKLPVDLVQILEHIKEAIKGRYSDSSGMQFGGALLAPHVSDSIMNDFILPAYNKILELGSNARDHPIAAKMLQVQEGLLENNPELKQRIASINVNKDITKMPNNPYENMNEQQMYHHLMTMSNDDWSKVQETAGVIAGKHRSKYKNSQSQGELHKIINKHVPELHDVTKPFSNLHSHDDVTKPFEKTSHLMDISMSRTPKIAAERIEHEEIGGSFLSALKGAFWTNEVADLMKSGQPIV